MDLWKIGKWCFFVYLFFGIGYTFYTLFTGGWFVKEPSTIGYFIIVFYSSFMVIWALNNFERNMNELENLGGDM